MLSKCANPECSEPFRFLHQGKLFYLAPAPGVPNADDEFATLPHERFWLCDCCCRLMTMVWEGAQAKLIPLPKPMATSVSWEEPRKQAANAGGRS